MTNNKQQLINAIEGNLLMGASTGKAFFFGTLKEVNLFLSEATKLGFELDYFEQDPEDNNYYDIAVKLPNRDNTVVLPTNVSTPTPSTNRVTKEEAMVAAKVLATASMEVGKASIQTGKVLGKAAWSLTSAIASAVATGVRAGTEAYKNRK